MELADPNFLVQKPKKERTPAQKLATQTAFTKLKEKREALKLEKEQGEEEVVEIRKISKKPTQPEPVKVMEEKPKPIVENNMNDDMINTIVSRLKSEMSPPPTVKEKKKKVVVVEEDSSSSEEEVVIRRKKIPKAEPVKAPEPVKVEAIKQPDPPKRSTGSRVLDNLFFSK